MYKLFVVAAAILAIFAVSEAHNQGRGNLPNGASQIIGKLSHSSVLLEEREIQIYNGHPTRQARRLINYPESAADEARTPRIGAVLIWLHGNTQNTRVKAIMGGRGHQFVGLEIKSGAGEHINARIEIYSF